MAEAEFLFDHRQERRQDDPQQHVEEKDAGQQRKQEDLGFPGEGGVRHEPALRAVHGHPLPPLPEEDLHPVRRDRFDEAAAEERMGDHIALLVPLRQSVIPDDGVRCVAAFRASHCLASAGRTVRGRTAGACPAPPDGRNGTPLFRRRSVVAVFGPAGLALHSADQPPHLIQDDMGQGKLTPRTEGIDIFSDQ